MPPVRFPSIYRPENFTSWPKTELEIDTDEFQWVAQRPEPLTCQLRQWFWRRWWHRLHCAWLVFTGRADVLEWEGNQ